MQNGMIKLVSESKPSSDSKKRKSTKAAGKAKSRNFQRPRGGEARAISDLMPEVGKAAFKRFGFVQSSIVSRWPEIVGDRYAKISAPDMIRFPRGKKSDGTLELTVSSAAAPMMQHVSPEIIERVNRFFGYAAISKIKMRQGHIAQPKQKHTPRAAPVLKAPPPELGDSLREIADPELQAVLQSLASSISADSLAKKAK